MYASFLCDFVCIALFLPFVLGSDCLVFLLLFFVFLVCFLVLVIIGGFVHWFGCSLLFFFLSCFYYFLIFYF